VIVADSAVGVVKPTMLRVDKKVPLDLGDLARKLRATLRLASADMSFSPISCIAFPMDLNLQLQAKRPGSSTPEVLQIPPSKVGSGTQSIVFDPVDVARFLSNISGQVPDSVRVVGSVTVNPEYDTTVVGCVGRNSSFSGALDLSIPLNLSISDGAFADTALFGDTTGSGERENRIDDKALNDVNYGKLYIEIENGLPMQVAMKIALLDRSKKFLLGLPQVPGDSIRISPAMVAGGEVQSPVKSVTVLQLQSSEVRQFNPAEFVQYAITLVTPPGQMVNFRTTDMVRVRIWAEFSYEVNP
jgi:hypothetical protein